MPHCRSLPCHLASPQSDESVLIDAVSDVPIPTPAEQKDLARRAHAGDRAAFDRLVLGNLRLVGKVASSFEGGGMSRADLIQEGTIGLMRAVEKFDPDLNIRLSTYATWWIRQAISRALADRGRTVRLPIKASDDLHALRRAARAVEASGHDVTPEALATLTGIAAERIRELQRLDRPVVSLDVPAGQGATMTLGDMQRDPDTCTEDDGVRSAMASWLYRAMFQLPAQARAVLALSAGLDGSVPHSTPEIARVLGIPAHRVRKLERQAMAELAQVMGVEEDVPEEIPEEIAGADDVDDVGGATSGEGTATPACPVEPGVHAGVAG